MNARERLLAAIAHREPDRVPVDMGATPSSGISAIAYSSLLEYARLSGTTDVYDVVQQLAQPSDEFVERFAIDVVDVGRAFDTRDEDWYAITLANGRPARYPAWFRPRADADGGYTALHPDGTPIARMPQGSAFYDQTCFPYLDDYPADYRDLGQAMDKVLWSHLVHSPWKRAGEPGFWDELRQRALTLRASTDRALMIVVGCNLFEWGTFLRRIDNFLMDLIAEPEQVEKLLDALMEKHLATLEKVCAAVGDVVDVLRFGDDLGTDSGLFMSPEIYRTLFKPRHAQLCAYVKQHSKMATFLHSCGAIRPIIPDLIEAGYDIINPVQTNARGMDPRELKRDFGRDVTFWGGGVDTRFVLNNGDPQAVKRQVIERLEIFSPGGGFVFNPVHNILPDVPPQNIVAMFDAIREFNGR
jgi:uroporphyrinogen decarboxylase